MDPAPTSPCTCFRVRRAARRLSQIFDSQLAAAGLSLNAYSILRRAAQPRLVSELAATLGMDRTTLTRNLTPLLRAGWLEQRAGANARQRVIALTPAGEACLQRARPLWQNAQDQVEAAFGADRIAELHRLLDALDAALPGGDPA